METTEAAIVASQLKKSFDELEVLESVNLTVEKGSIFALLGSNGAGKTTTIRILATLLRPDGGSAQVYGFDVVQEPGEVRGVISLTGQFAAVDDILTGRENLVLIGRLRHLEDARAKANELLERFGLLEAADRRVATYSGGMRRRLDLAMGLMGSPPVIFLDEPTTGLDPQARLAMWEIIEGLADSGVTIFLTTQYLEEADRLANQIAILHHGRIVAQGTPAQLKKQLPQGTIELEFPDVDSLNVAHDFFGDLNPHVGEKRLVLSIATDGSTGQLMSILKRSESAGLPVSQFRQKPPSLEDVFLAIVNENMGQEEAQ